MSFNDEKMDDLSILKRFADLDAEVRMLRRMVRDLYDLVPESTGREEKFKDDFKDDLKEIRKEFYSERHRKFDNA